MSNNFRAKSLFVRLCAGTLTIGVMSALMAQNVPPSPQARVLVTQPVESTRLHKLAGNTRAEANARNDRGRVADTFPMNHMLLQLRRRILRLCGGWRWRWSGVLRRLQRWRRRLYGERVLRREVMVSFVGGPCFYVKGKKEF